VIYFAAFLSASFLKKQRDRFSAIAKMQLRLPNENFLKNTVCVAKVLRYTVRLLKMEATNKANTKLTTDFNQDNVREKKKHKVDAMESRIIRVSMGKTFSIKIIYEFVYARVSVMYKNNV
jgi:hypothetical protein